MKIAFLTIIVSPHQLPLAHEIVKRVGAENFCYAFVEGHDYEREGMGWGNGGSLPWCRFAKVCRAFLESADLLCCGERDLDLMEMRLRNHKLTCYSSERWFKPIEKDFNLSFFNFHLNLIIPGWLRLLVPSYFKMARRFVKFFDSPDFRYLAMGSWAERDMRLIYRVFYPLTANGRIKDKIIPWGYFVSPSEEGEKVGRESRSAARAGTIRVLWVGRMLKWKRVDTIIRAVALANRSDVKSRADGEERKSIFLTIVGDGPEKSFLQKLASDTISTSYVNFLPSVPIAEIRNLMRQHDIYVLASNGQEGWGAALNEAMEEGMLVLGTYEAGSSSYMLPETNLFHAGDWRRLAELLRGKIPFVPIGKWSAKAAAGRLLEFREEHEYVHQR